MVGYNAEAFFCKICSFVCDCGLLRSGRFPLIPVPFQLEQLQVLGGEEVYIFSHLFPEFSGRAKL